MRTLIISDFAQVNGGAAKVAVDSAVALSNAGVDVHFVYAVGEADPNLSDAGVQVHHIPCDDVWTQPNALKAARDSVWNAQAKSALDDLFGDIVDDDTIIHVHQWSKAFSPSVFAAARDVGAPVFLTAHDYFFGCPNGAYFNFPALKPCGLRPFTAACAMSNCDRVARRHKLVRLARHQRLLNVARDLDRFTIVHVSEFARGVGEPLTGFDARHLVIANPADVRPRRTAAPASTRGHALYVGRLTPEKGCDVFVRAARAAGVRPELIGEGPQEAALRAAYPDLEILPWVNDRRALLDRMARARVLVAPSLWPETFGLTVLEGLSAGVPAIVTQTCGVAEFVREGRTGWRVPPGDVDAWTRALRLAFDLPDAELDAMSARALSDTAWDRVSFDAHARRLIDEYGTALKLKCAA